MDSQYGNLGAWGARADEGLGVESDRLPRQASVTGRNPARLLSKHEESQLALQYVLNAIRGDVSIDALERAVATVKAHLEASA